MSYTPEHKRQTREKILTAAGKLFKRDGYDATGIDTIMADAGLTRGGFYAHFVDKEDLFSRIVLPRKFDSQPSSETFDPTVQLSQIFDYYLSIGHRDNPGEGCALPALSADIARTGGQARRRYTAIFRGFWKIISRNIGTKRQHDCDQTAQAILSMMIGGVIVSRALGKGEASTQVLAACHESCEKLAKIR